MALSSAAAFGTVGSHGDLVDVRCWAAVVLQQRWVAACVRSTAVVDMLLTSRHWLSLVSWLLWSARPCADPCATQQCPCVATLSYPNGNLGLGMTKMPRPLLLELFIPCDDRLGISLSFPATRMLRILLFCAVDCRSSCYGVGIVGGPRGVGAWARCSKVRRIWQWGAPNGALMAGSEWRWLLAGLRDAAISRGLVGCPFSEQHWPEDDGLGACTGSMRRVFFIVSAVRRSHPMPNVASSSNNSARRRHECCSHRKCRACTACGTAGRQEDR